jgi:hypothetical protein
VQQLSDMHKDVKNRKMKDEQRREAKKKKIEEQKEKEKKFIALQGDVRDKFLFNVPFLAPDGFKPLEEHMEMCKICYEQKIDTLLMPCRHELFCHVCAKFLKDEPREGFEVCDKCPLCAVKFDSFVRIYKLDKS